MVCNFSKDNLDRFAYECAEIFSRDYALAFAMNDLRFAHDFKNCINKSSPRSAELESVITSFLHCQNSEPYKNSLFNGIHLTDKTTLNLSEKKKKNEIPSIADENL